MTDTATVKAVPAYSAFGEKTDVKATVTFRDGHTREFTLTQAQEDAAQALARGEYVKLTPGSGRMVIRQRQLDILAAGGGSKPGAKKTGSTTVFPLLKFVGADFAQLLGVFSSKTSAKAAAEADFETHAALTEDVSSDDFEGLATRWVNDKNESSTPDITLGTETVAYQVVGKTLRK